MSINPGQIVILPTTKVVRPIYELVAKLPPFYEINPAVLISVAINSLSLINGGVLEVLLEQFLKEIETAAWNNSNALLSPAHEQEIAMAVINMYQELSRLFTNHQLWHGAGVSYWKFYRFLEYDIMLVYQGQRIDEIRSSPTGTSPTTL